MDLDIHIILAQDMYGQSRSAGQVVGDVIFLHDNGLPFCVFSNVSDPVNLVRLVKSLVKHGLDSLDR